jgi:hypothetical protein
MVAMKIKGKEEMLLLGWGSRRVVLCCLPRSQDQTPDHRYFVFYFSF